MWKAFPCHGVIISTIQADVLIHDDVIKWKHFPRYWPFVRGIHRSPVNSPHKGQWRGALIFSLICARINGWVNNREAGDFRRYRAHYDVIVMIIASAFVSTVVTTLGSFRYSFFALTPLDAVVLQENMVSSMAFGLYHSCLRRQAINSGGIDCIG